MHDSIQTNRRDSQKFERYAGFRVWAVSALLGLCALYNSGCVLIAPAVLAAATVLPERPVPQTVAEVGGMSREEGIVFGSMSIDVSDLSNMVADWDGLDFSIPGAGEEATYSLLVMKLGRRGEPLPEQHWEADCRPGKTCRFVAKLEAGNYIANGLRISKSDDENYMLDFGYVLTRLDYRFSVDAGRIKYVGRLDMTPPVFAENGERKQPVEITDAAADDTEAVGLADDDAYVVALIDRRWQSDPVAVYGLVR